MIEIRGEYIMIAGLGLALAFVYFYLVYLSRFLDTMRYRRLSHNKKLLVLKKQGAKPQAEPQAEPWTKRPRLRGPVPVPGNGFVSLLRRLAYKLFLG